MGRWNVSEDEGIVILDAHLAPSEYVFDEGDRTPRLRTAEETRLVRMKSGDLNRIRLKLIRDIIRQKSSEFLVDPFFAIPDTLPSDDIARKQIELIQSAAQSKSASGRRRTSDAELDEWARDVWKIVSEGPKESLYQDLVAKWGVSESTVKNFRLPLLRDKGRLSGKGRSSMTRGPSYPIQKMTDG